MLTVDFRRLGLQAGDRVLDLGCGAGRHAFEAHRRGAHTVAYDRNGGDVKDAAAMLGAMRLAGEAPAGALGTAVNGAGCAGDASAGGVGGASGGGSEVCHGNCGEGGW